MRPFKRMHVYTVIDDERDYQDRKWGGARHDSQHSIKEWLNFMEEYLIEAIELSAGGEDKLALEAIKKITALGVACMENHNIMKRH